MIYNLLNFCNENDIYTVLIDIETEQCLEIVRMLIFVYRQGYLFGRLAYLND